ncbi:hypothetical protein EDB81DRAFT_859845 [Dactylonectria macrodidyma]|uniref:Uncharacterized protein n=1 Tax=Dactylonectria macrodidyma TaxID=307937 RepID=A0A9P9E3I1_9HYPO|nr:hypothetical protein EDB81DRAFT_859845 [Dactylonectria macrodidyma]
MASQPEGLWTRIDKKTRRIRVPQPYRHRIDQRGLRAAVRFYGCLRIWPWDLLPDLYVPKEWGVGLLQSIARLALDYSQAKNLTVDDLRERLLESIMKRSRNGEQMLRYADVHAVRAEFPINLEDLPEREDNAWDDLADDSASSRKRIKMESPDTSHRTSRGMKTPPPTLEQSAEARRGKIAGYLRSATSTSRESALQRPPSSEDTNTSSLAIVYSDLLIKAAERKNSAPVPSSIHDSLRPALTEFDARLDSLLKEASRTYEAADAKLNEKLAQYQELKLQNLSASNESVNRAKQALRDAQGRHKALVAEADELDATVKSLSGTKILGNHGKAPRLPQLGHAIDAYDRLSHARRWEARGEERNIVGLQEKVVEAKRLAKQSNNVVIKLKREVSDASKASKTAKAGVEALKNVKTMVLGVEQTIPDLEKIAMS